MDRERESYEAARKDFAAAVQQMTSVRVAEGSHPHSTSIKRRNSEFRPLLFSEDNPSAIEELRSAFALNTQDDGGNWMEQGSPTLTLCAGERDLISVSVLGGTYLRFYDVATWDAPLHDPALLGQWLSVRLPSAR